jgi:hypothetical protein
MIEDANIFIVHLNSSGEAASQTNELYPLLLKQGAQCVGFVL